MGWFERVFGGLLGGAEPPALPGPGPGAALARWDDAVEVRADSVYNQLTGLGDPSRDKGAVGRPSRFVMPLDDEELQAAYQFNGATHRIVSVLPQKATRKGWSCPDVPDNEHARLLVWDRICEAMIWSRVYGGSVVLMVTEDDLPRAARARPQDWLMQPLDLRRVGRLAALHVFDAWGAQPLAWNDNPLDPAFGEPDSWWLTRGRWSARVHSTRLLWFRGNRRAPNDLQGGWMRSNRMPDDSAIQVVWDEIQRLCSTMQGGAILAQELRESVVKVAGYSSKATGDDRKALKAQLGLMARTKALLNLIVLGEHDSYENRSNPPTGFKELSEGALTMLCMVLGWPRVMLTGEAPGGLSTDDKSGLERERQLVSDYQERHRRQLERLYTVVTAAQDGPTGGRVPDELGLTFAPQNEPTDGEIADLREKVAKTDAIYIQAGVYGPEHVAESRFGDEGWSLDMMAVPIPDPEDDERAIERARQLLEAAGGGGAGAAGDEGDDAEPRADAGGAGCFVVVPAAPLPADLTSAVAAALGSPPLPSGTEAHVTVLYVGEDLPGDAVSEVVTVTTSEAAEIEVYPLGGGQLRAFPAGPRGVPIVVELADAWGLEQLHDRLLRRLAHRVNARQHRRFRAHLTLGYVPELSTEAATRLMAVDASAVRVPVLELRVRAGGRTVATVAVGGEG